MPPDSSIMYSAFTVAELGEMLPVRYVGYGRLPNGDWCAEYDHETFVAHTEAAARAKMLVYLIANKLIAV